MAASINAMSFFSDGPDIDKQTLQAEQQTYCMSGELTARKGIPRPNTAIWVQIAESV